MNYIQHLIIKLISFLAIWTLKWGSMSKNKITILQTSVNWVCGKAFSIFTHWISRPFIQKYKNHSKASSGAGDSLKIFMHARSHDSTYRILNQEDTIDVTLSGVVNHNAKPLRLIFHILVWRLREGRTVKLKLLLLVDGIKCFVLLIFVKILLFVDLQKWNHRFCLLMNQTYGTITY